MLGIGPLSVLSIGVLTSAFARGVDFWVTPIDNSVTMTAIGDWADPHMLGTLLVAFSLIGLVAGAFRRKALIAWAHIALGALFLMMGLVSLFPVMDELGWGWRAPVSYILGSAVVHWYAGNSWYSSWTEARGKRTGPDSLAR